PLDASLARETHLEALMATIWVRGSCDRDGVLEAAEAARAAPPSPKPGLAPDVLLDALALRLTEGYAAAAPTLARAIRTFPGVGAGPEEGISGLLPAGGINPSLTLGEGDLLRPLIALEVWDDETLHAEAARQVRLARDTGALAPMQCAVNFLAVSHVFAGDLA